MKKIIALLLVALLLVSILPVAVVATQVAPTDTADSTATADTTDPEMKENCTPSGSLLNWLMGDAEEFINNERMLFTGEAGDLNVRLLIVACVAVLLLPAGVFLWGAAKPLKVVLDFVLGYMELMLTLLLMLIAVAMRLLEQFGAAVARAGKLIWEILKSARRRLDDWIKQTDYTVKDLKMIERVLYGIMVAFLVFMAWAVYNYEDAKALCAAAVIVIVMYIDYKFVDKRKKTEMLGTEELTDEDPTHEELIDE